MTRDLQAHETEIRGEWIATGKNVVGDTACERIEWLTTSSLVRLASDASGWETLYTYPRTGRLWERTYPHGEWHGGGPPMLRAISLVEAQVKYGALAEQNAAVDRGE
jgi:hypothetical protein